MPTVDYTVLSLTGAAAHREQYEMKLELVRRLLLKKITGTTEIQKTLYNMDPPIRLTVRTINRYKQMLARRNLEALKSLDGAKRNIEQIALDLKDEYDEVTKELWRQYHDPATPKKTKVTCLSEIRDTTDKLIKTLQALGLIDEAPVKHQLLDASGQPTTPEYKIELNQEFIAFVRARFQQPLGVDEKIQNLTPQAPAP